jgi:hypothetical protein
MRVLTNSTVAPKNEIIIISHLFFINTGFLHFDTNRYVPQPAYVVNAMKNVVSHFACYMYMTSGDGISFVL